MTLRIISPFRQDKNLGRAYNESINELPDDAVIILKDIDTCFVLPDTPAHLLEYHNRYPDALITCYTNRLSHLAVSQLVGGKLSDDSDMKTWIEIAKQKQKALYNVTHIHQDISGMLMVMSKKFWQRFKFPENPFPERGGCIGVDSLYGRQVRNGGAHILRADGCFVYHVYRMFSDVKDKSHLI